MAWTDVLNQLLCSKRIDGYALLDPSTGNVVLAFGVLYEGFMVPNGDGEMSPVEERLALSESLQLEDIPGSITVKGRKMVVVRREASHLFAVGYRKRYSVSVHSLYAGILIVAYSKVYSLGDVLQGICDTDTSSKAL